MKVIFENEDLKVVDKPAGVDVENIPLRVHRLDKDTSGVFLIAKNEKALKFFQKQFKERKVKKKYIALVVGHLSQTKGVIESFLGRSPKDRRKQKVFLPLEPRSEGKREAITFFKVLKRFKNYDLIEVEPKTGRKHQIRVHLAFLKHPIAGDKLYGFKNQPSPPGLKRQFLHSFYIKIALPSGEEKVFKSSLPQDLKNVLDNLEKEKK